MDWLRKIFKRNRTPEKKNTNTIAQRANLAVDSLFENESLTSDLDDPSASILLKWGVGLAQEIADQTNDLDVDISKITISGRMNATRRLMRLSNRWASQHSELNLVIQASILKQIDEQMRIIRGSPDARRGLDELDQFLLENQEIHDTAILIENLRQFYDKPPGSI